jgi:anti-sigma factor RsiW
MGSSAHPPDGELRALLDGELPVADRTAVQQHVAACSTCPARLTAIQQASQATEQLLGLLVPPQSSLRLNDVKPRARWTRTRRAGLIAAAVTVVVAATAGATVGRPYVRALVARIWRVVHPTAEVPLPVPSPVGGLQAGVAVVPGAVADIVFDTTQASGLMRVSLADTTELSIRSSAPVTYRVYLGGVFVHNRGSAASYEVTIPRAAPHVRIAIAGRVMLEKTGAHIAAASVADSAGGYVIIIQ